MKRSRENRIRVTVLRKVISEMRISSMFVDAS